MRNFGHTHCVTRNPTITNWRRFAPRKHAPHSKCDHVGTGGLLSALARRPAGTDDGQGASTATSREPLTPPITGRATHMRVGPLSRPTIRPGSPPIRDKGQTVRYNPHAPPHVPRAASTGSWIDRKVRRCSVPWLLSSASLRELAARPTFHLAGNACSASVVLASFLCKRGYTARTCYRSERSRDPDEADHVTTSTLRGHVTQPGASLIT